MKRMAMTILFALISSTAYAQYAHLQVPFKSQSPPGDWNHNMNCGPTSALMTAGYYFDFQPTEDDLKMILDWLYAKNYIEPQPGAEYYDGNLTNTFHLSQILTEYYNLQGTVKNNNSDLEILYDQLQKGNPIIVAVNVRMDPGAMGHFMVVVGIENHELIVHDPGRSFGADKRYHEDMFMASWATSNYASLTVDKPVVTWHPNGSLVKSYSGNRVYQIVGERLRHVEDEAVFNGHTFFWDQIINVSELEINCFDTGEQIDWVPYREPFKIENTYFMMEQVGNGFHSCAIYEFASQFAFQTWNIPGEIQVMANDQEAEDTYFWHCDLGDFLYLRDGILVKPDFDHPDYGDGVVFVATENGWLQPFETEQVFQEMGYENLALHHVDEETFYNSFRGVYKELLTEEMSHQCLSGYYDPEGGGFGRPDPEDLDDDGYSPYEGDCNENDPMIHPGVLDPCDGIDNDCDLVIDEDAQCGLDEICVRGSCQRITAGDEDAVEEEEFETILELVEDEPEPEPEPELEFEPEFEPESEPEPELEQNPCANDPYCLQCQSNEDCPSGSVCLGNMRVGFSGICQISGTCYGEVEVCSHGCEGGFCNQSAGDIDEVELPEQPEGGDNDVAAEELPEEEEQFDSEESERISLHCTVVCPEDMTAFVWYGWNSEVSGHPAATVDTTMDVICERGRPWLDFNCACREPHLWACFDWTVAQVQCDHEYSVVEGDYGKGKIWLTGAHCH